ncbi:hypothetical protein P8605_10040 [Streptomyces sp. T-3]|nr:hypothetical protein [Streptomyces sp. T-3]
MTNQDGMPPQPGFGPPQPGAFPPPPAHAPAPAPAPAPSPAPGYAPAPPQYQQFQQFQQPQPAGPEFLAVDKHNAVVVDIEGISFDRNGQTADFPWAQISQVHYTAQGTHLLVGVTHAGGHFFECRVNAKRQDQLHQWFAQLAPVLGHYRPM